MAMQNRALAPAQTFTHFAYLPNIGANALYISILGLCIFAQTALGIKYQTWGFTCAMLGGLLLEIVGYISRIFMSMYPEQRAPFLASEPSRCAQWSKRAGHTEMFHRSNIALVIGPAFLAAAIYLCMGRIVVVYGRHLSRLSVRTSMSETFSKLRSDNNTS